MNHLTDLLYASLVAAIEAGRLIMRIYDTAFEVEYKSDASPLTVADKQSAAHIASCLEHFSLPALNEETDHESWENRRKWKRFWLIDPLDGTKEFVNRNGEFTVNIGLIDNGIPVMGVIYTPATGELFWGGEGIPPRKAKVTTGDLEADIDLILSLAQPLGETGVGRPFTVVASRSHMNDATLAYLETLRQRHGSIEVISRGSALKFCLLAEGKADAYARLAPTMEWDTAAGHAIVRAVGFRVFVPETGEELAYNKQILTNPGFLVERK